MTLKKAENDSTDRPELSPPGVTSLDDSIVLPGPSTGESSGESDHSDSGDEEYDDQFMEDETG